MRSVIHLTAIATITAIAICPVGSAFAAEHTVKMLNKGAKGGMVFEPDLVKALPGDTIRFVPADKGHNVESIKGMLPEGAAEFKSAMNEEFVLTPEAEGVYGVKCTPHYGMGMVALIAVGNPTNAETARAVKQTGKAKSRFEEIFEELE
jgi:pseudoazurin